MTLFEIDVPPHCPAYRLEVDSDARVISLQVIAPEARMNVLEAHKLISALMACVTELLRYPQPKETIVRLK